MHFSSSCLSVLHSNFIIHYAWVMEVFLLTTDSVFLNLGNQEMTLVMHGGIDGLSCLITFVNGQWDTVIDCFLRAA